MVVAVGSRHWSGTICRANHSAASRPPSGSLWSSVVTATRFPTPLPRITNRYQIACHSCENHWCFWFGRIEDYQSLPHGTCTAIGDSGEVVGRFTNAYQHLPFAQIDLRPFTFTIAPPPRLGLEDILTYIDSHILKGVGCLSRVEQGGGPGYYKG